MVTSRQVLEATRAIKAEFPDVNVIIVADSEGRESQRVQAIWPRGPPPDILDEFVRLAREPASEPAGPEQGLTEREVLRLVA